MIQLVVVVEDIRSKQWDTKIKQNKNKEVRYLNKDFSQFRNNLIEFSKQYFPNTYQDFNESSPGMMFIEMILCR